MGSTTSDLINYDQTGNEFIRAVSRVLLDEWKIIGNGDFMKRNHVKIVDFKYPHEIEQLFDFTIRDQPDDHHNLLDIVRKTIAYSIKTSKYFPFD